MDLESIIKLYVHPLVPGNKGWFKTRCMVCNDHQPGTSGFKGLRGNFLLDGNILAYNCYNCGIKTKFDPMTSNGFSKTFIEIFKSFNIPETEYNKVLINNLGNYKKKSNIKQQLIDIEPKKIKLPEHFYLLKDADDKWATIARHYLKKRLIEPDGHEFFLSTGKGKYGKKWKGRVIFTVYKDSKLVYYQGRALINSLIRKYETPAVDKCNILYNYDALQSYSEKPVFIVEGWFDAVLINGVAIFGKYLSKEQIMWLSKSPREKVIIPDKFGDGQQLANQAINLGWSVSFPEFGNCKDVTDAMIKFGKLYVIDSIMKNIKKSVEAQICVKLYCK